jgi:methionyl-tRNA formyltransferase
MFIACSDGYISVKSLQIAGKKRMDVEFFLRGLQGRANEISVK